MKAVFIAFVSMLVLSACSKPGGQHAVIETSMGDIEIVLYDETPLHRDNFIKLAKEKYYDGLLFHRVIPNQRELLQRHSWEVAGLDMKSKQRSELLILKVRSQLPVTRIPKKCPPGRSFI